MPDSSPKTWASWDPETNSLTISRPPELTNEQLERIWSPFINHWTSASTLAMINRAIEDEVRVARARGEQERQEAQRRREEEEQRRREEAARLDREREAAKKEATEKAEALLARSLTAQQKQDLQEKNYFLVQVRSETYKIKRGFAGNVKLLGEDGTEVKSFCIHPHERVPDADAMLAQKLLLETDPDRFHRTANVTDLVPASGRRAA